MNIKWTEKEKEYVREHAAHMKDAKLAEKLTEITGREVTLDAVRKVRQKLGLRKSPGRGVCSLVYSPIDEIRQDISSWENEGGPPFAT